MNDERFDDLLQEMRDEDVPRDEFLAARERVWTRLQGDESLACEELRPELRDYAAGRMAPDRRLLLDDHLARCVDCRHALADVKRAGRLIEMPARPRPGTNWYRWVAAAAVLAAVLYLGRGALDSMLAPAGPSATVAAASGTLFQPSGAILPVGAEVFPGQVVRTAAGARAVLRLRDGSLVEMNQRTELALQSARSGDTIRLSWGDVIVEAADQGARNLRVVTRDSIASVKGTVFAVSSGMAGSLVSVVEGSVEVAHAGTENLLYAGQQAASNPALTTVGVSQAVSWSDDAEEYYALLAELAQIEEQLALSGPSMRTDPRLLPYLPANVSAYFAIPNLDGAIEQAIRLVDRRATPGSALAKWWSSDDGRKLRAVLERLQSVGERLGDELVLVWVGIDEPMPLFLAEVRSGSDDQLLQLLQDLEPGADELPPVQVVDGLLLASDSPANLALLSAQLGAGAGSPFAVEIREHYRRGIGWLGAFDVAVVSTEIDDTAFTTFTGLSSMRYLFVEQRSGAGGDESEATLSFRGARAGMASWIAAPGALGSADYVSADAIAASANSTRDPVEAFDQLMSLMGGDPEFVDDIGEIENETGIDVRDDIAASLGSDFVVALEGISVTEPQWIAVFEVLNPGALDDALRRMVERVNAEIDPTDADAPRLVIAEEEVNGRTWKSLSAPGDDFPGFTWTYDRGYAVVGGDRATALRAIGVRDSAASLTRSARFLQQLPSGTGVHTSGFVWLDMSRFAELMETLGDAGPIMATSAEPILVVITGGDDFIRWASRTRLTSMIFDLLPVG